MTTKTEAIFQLSAPYDNPYQGTDKRLLFVCSAGILRSATGANLYAKKGFNTRNCGTHAYALIPLSANLIMWADKIIFVNKENYLTATDVFKASEVFAPLYDKSVVLNIPDDYEYNNPELIKHFEEQLGELS